MALCTLQPLSGGVAAKGLILLFFFFSVHFMRIKIGFICQISYVGRKTAGLVKNNIAFYCCWTQTREALLLIHQPEDQVDCCWIGFHICDIGVLDGNERESVRVREKTRAREMCGFYFSTAR